MTLKSNYLNENIAYISSTDLLVNNILAFNVDSLTYNKHSAKQKDKLKPTQGPLLYRVLTPNCFLIQLQHMLQLSQELNLNFVIAAIPYTHNMITGFHAQHIWLCSETDDHFVIHEEFGQPTFISSTSELLSISTNFRNYSGEYSYATMDDNLYFRFRKIVNLGTSVTHRPRIIYYPFVSGPSVHGFVGCDPEFWKGSCNVTNEMREYLNSTQDAPGTETYEFFWEMLG